MALPLVAQLVCGGKRRGHMLVYISSCWLSVDHNNMGPASVEHKLGGTSGDTIVSGRLSVSSTGKSWQRDDSLRLVVGPPRWRCRRQTATQDYSCRAFVSADY
ncbi:hypothetical protein EYF80_004442 [Liparis tanakae]|uniref:Uncharacterized protein n=1 Tax=Liparis tanakae TaxID=230148 RepID=A0A4Z2J5G6_9TELE|nr:hypothetical protein EYF80_004442 [Liparis tanakae]